MALHVETGEETRAEQARSRTTTGQASPLAPAEAFLDLPTLFEIETDLREGSSVCWRTWRHTHM